MNLTQYEARLRLLSCCVHERWPVNAPVAGAYEEDADVRDPFDTREFYELCQTYRHSRDYGPIGSPALVVEAFEAVKDFGKRAVARSISDGTAELERLQARINQLEVESMQVCPHCNPEPI
jgi:hypothetical protein